MPGIRLRLHIGRFADIHQLIAAFNTPELRRIANAAFRPQARRLRLAFRHGGHQHHGGARWAPLAESTIREKQRRGFPRKPLVRTGSMRDAVRFRHIGQGRRNRGVIELHRHVIPYASFHQHGTRNMPQRRILVVTSEDRRLIARDIREAVNTLVNGGRR